MEGITIYEHGEQVTSPAENTIVGDIRGTNTTIEFKGTGNILYCEDGVQLDGCEIKFCTVNAVVYLSAGRWPYKLKIDAWRDTTAYFGKDNYYNGVLSAILSEKRSIIVGGGGVFSFGIWIRTADPHILYDAHSHERINPSRSVLIGDHVWMGQNATILKGTQIGSGSVLAANAVVSGKSIASNTVWGGNPARRLKKDVFFSGASVHDYTEAQTKASQAFPEDTYLYQETEQRIRLQELDDRFFRKSPEERVEILKELASNEEKNRFFVSHSAGGKGWRAVFGK